MKPSLNIPVEITPGVFELNEIPNVTGIELDLLLYLSKIQDQFGNIKGLYYKDVCKELNCCKQSFYNALQGLETKGYILINFTYKEQNYWDLTILDNIFISEKDDKKRYLNTNRKIFNNDRFRSLRVNEKKLLLKLALDYNSVKGKTFYPERVLNWLGIKSISLAWEYINNISNICPLVITPGKHGDLIKIETDNLTLTDLSEQTEKDNFFKHRLTYLLRKSKIGFTADDIKDLITLINQKTLTAGICKVFNVICHVIDTYKSVEGALINKLLTPDPKTGDYPALYT